MTLTVLLPLLLYQPCLLSQRTLKKTNNMLLFLSKKKNEKDYRFHRVFPQVINIYDYLYYPLYYRSNNAESWSTQRGGRR